MRREEVALEAGISVTWYTWLEQGRAESVSKRTLAAIGRALQLDAVAMDHLEQLAVAAEAPPAAARPRDAQRCSEDLAELVEALSPHPAYVVNGQWDVLIANTAATAVLGDFFLERGTTDNILRRLFLDSDWRARFADWHAVAASAVAQYRAATATMVGDASWRAAIDELAALSPEFSALWTEHAIAPSIARQKVVQHPDAGRLTFTYASLAPDGEHDALRLIVYLPLDAETSAAVARLATARATPGTGAGSVRSRARRTG